MEKTYPIYRFTFKWIQNDNPSKQQSLSNEYLPNGKIYNSTSFKQMYKEEKNINELQQILTDYWLKYSKEKNNIKDKNPELVLSNFEFIENETWCIGWFNHYTFDEGQSDTEVINSFAKFVDRKKILGEDKYCLMGADERWRWCGSDDNGKTNININAPCRCKFCKEQGVIRINH